MSEVFISHSSKNQQKAEELQRELEAKGASVFLAPSTLAPGAKWSGEILAQLRESKLVLLLACKEACESKAVNQEIGGTILMNKELVPVLDGISPEELPGWSREFQAVELTEDRWAVRKVLDGIAEKLRRDRFWGTVFAVGLILFVLWVFMKKD